MRFPPHLVHLIRALRGAVFAAIVAFMGPASATAAEVAPETGPALQSRAAELAREGRCQEALPLLDEARSSNRGDAELASLQGQCRIRTGAYVAAASSLADARELDPERDDVALYLGIAHYHLGDFAKANANLAVAESASRAGRLDEALEPQLQLYLGLLRIQQGELRQGVEALDTARRLDADQVEPVASYYAALAWQGLNEREEAKAALERVKAVDGDGEWARRAELALGHRELEDRDWVSLTVGLEYDTNVILLGNGIALGPEISSEADGRGVWYLEGGAELFRSERWSGGLVASYTGNAHFSLREFDTHYPTAGGWVDFDVDNQTLLRARYDAGFAWVNYESFATTQDAVVSLFRTWGEPGQTELFAGWDWNDFHFDIPVIPTGVGAPGDLCPGVSAPPPPIPSDTSACSPPGVDTQSALDRDGNGLRVGVEHRYDWDTRGSRFFRDLELRGGYTFERYWSRGTEYLLQSHTVGVAIEAEIPWRLNVIVSGGFIARPFDNRSVLPDPNAVFAGRQYALSPERRKDWVGQATVIVERPIREWLDVEARYQYFDNASNVAVYDYDRQIVGGYLVFHF